MLARRGRTQLKTGSTDWKLLVIAPNLRWFNDWCRDNNIDQVAHEVRFVKELTDLFGYEKAWYKDLGTSSKRAEELYHYLEVYKMSRGFKEVHMLRPCEVWAIPRKRLGRIKHRMTYGHKRHECIVERGFAMEHEADHKCACGFTWPHQSSDND